MSTHLLKQYLFVKAWLAQEEGQDMIEYALIVVLIVIAGAVGMAAVGTKISTLWGTIVALFP